MSSAARGGPAIYNPISINVRLQHRVFFTNPLVYFPRCYLFENGEGVDRIAADQRSTRQQDQHKDRLNFIFTNNFVRVFSGNNLSLNICLPV